MERKEILSIVDHTLLAQNSDMGRYQRNIR